MIFAKWKYIDKLYELVFDLQSDVKKLKAEIERMKEQQNEA